jgi:hypothetical protein
MLKKAFHPYFFVTVLWQSTRGYDLNFLSRTTGFAFYPTVLKAVFYNKEFGE